MILYTQGEVAERLGCSVEQVKRLRLSGQLAYYAGKPVLVGEDDLTAYMLRAARLVDEKEAAKRLGCSIRGVQQLRRTGELPYTASGRILYDAADLDAYAQKVAEAKQAEAEADRLLALRRRVFAHQWRRRLKR